MKDKLDAYEIIGVVAPGSIVVFAGLFFFPEMRHFLVADGLTAGGLGLFVILSFVAGHLLQALGNVLEWCLWLPFGGMPSHWVAHSDSKLLSINQMERLQTKIGSGMNESRKLSELTASERYALAREIYAKVAAANRATRIDSFNRTYGLLRGVAAGLLAAFIGTLIYREASVETVVMLAVVTAIAIYRMYRFGVHYARELYVQFLAL